LRDVVEEVAVVGDRDDGARIGGQMGFEPLHAFGVEIPGAAMIQLLLQRTHFGYQRVGVVVGEAGGDLGIAGQQRFGIGDTGSDIAEHVVTLVEDRLLRQQPHGDVRRWPCVPVRRLPEPGHTRNRVDFPAPLGPTTPILAPGRNDRVTSSRITLSPRTTRARLS
jgi:hypothetical protein